MRIQKAITDSGLASRREAEAMIIEGRVKVNKELVLHPNTDVNPHKDEIFVDGKPLPLQERKVYYAYHKPKNTICVRDDPQERPSVFDHLSIIPHRIEVVGRLDFNTTGLLLLTNDGVVAHGLTQPAFAIPKRYRVKVWKRPIERQLNRIRYGLQLEGERSKPAKIKIVNSTETDNTWLELTTTEGRNRIIRQMFEAINHPVSKLQRISFATINLGRLDSRQYRPLNGEELERIRTLASGQDVSSLKKKSKYKKGYARPKIKKSHLRKKKR
jgi:23S rRNA pseudouridine2605 synthase